MKMVYDDLVEKKDELPKDFSGIANLEETMEKVDSLIDAYKTINTSSSKSAKGTSSNDTSSSTAECTSGPCCDVATLTFRPAGAGCVVSDPCQEPAELCSGDSATCTTTDKVHHTLHSSQSHHTLHSLLFFLFVYLLHNHFN